MAKKRKSDASRLDEVDRSMYSTFCSAASFLSQLYTQSMHQQRLSFQAGERHALEKLQNWIVRQQEDGVRVTPADILAYMQNELDFGTEEPPSPRLPLPQQQHPQTAAVSATQPVFPAPFGAASIAQGQQRPVISDQSKSNVFSNALSSPVRRSLQQHYHLMQRGGYNSNNSTRNSESSGNQIRDSDPLSSNDTPMDMHPDSPGHDSPY